MFAVHKGKKGFVSMSSGSRWKQIKGRKTGHRKSIEREVYDGPFSCPLTRVQNVIALTGAMQLSSRKEHEQEQ